MWQVGLHITGECIFSDKLLGLKKQLVCVLKSVKKILEMV